MRTSSVRASAADPSAQLLAWVQAARYISARCAVARAVLALLGSVLLSAGQLGCAATPAASDPSAELAADLPPSARAAPLEFSFLGGDDVVVSSATTRGRVTVLAFVATYDMASQIALRRLAEVIVRFTPRANAAAVVLEAPRYAELLPAYRDTLQLPFPVVMVDFATAQGQGPFAWIERVPTFVVLDRSGREVARRHGSQALSELEGDLARASRTPR